MMELNQINSTSESDSVDKGEKSSAISPLLCQHCQPWNDIWNWGPTRGAAMKFESISNNVECLVCKAVTGAVNTRRGESEVMRTWIPSKIFVRNDGPFFLDKGFYPPYSPNRVDASNPQKNWIRFIMKLHVGFLGDEAVSPDDAYTLSLDVVSRSTKTIVMTPQFCLSYSKGDASTFLAIESWETPYFDTSLLREWMQGCKAIHGVQCVESEPCQVDYLPSLFRVIDVESMTVVRPLHTVTFVALSYMWPQNPESMHVQLEKANVAALEKIGGIEGVNLPQIITDAINLCRDLGETYLWIDQLCIVQDDMESKLDQIRGMDKIYRSAALTITVAVNSRDGQGIPGYGSRLRKASVWAPPRDIEIEGRGIRPTGTETVDSSLWNKRGWTFQERILSRRRLLITEFQVLFECSQGQASEDFTLYRQYNHPIHVSEERSKQESSIEDEEERQISGYIKHSEIHLPKDDPVQLLIKYCDWTEDYTKRQLTKATDILNAFAGVGNYLGETLGSHLLFGLPEKFIAQALMWSHHGSVERRLEMPHIPTWSWASCLTPADYYWILQASAFQKEAVSYIASLVYFYFQDPGSGLRKLAAREQWMYYEETKIEDLEHEEGVPAIGGKYVPADLRTNQTWRECPHGPWQTLAHRVLDPAACKVAGKYPGSLVFNTTVASLKLGPDVPERDPFADASDSDDKERDVALHNQDGVLIGWLNKMSNDWIDAAYGKESTLEMIVLSGGLADYRTRKTMGWYLKDWDMWRLNVMLIERLRDHPCVARRVDVGYIFAHKWKDCSPRWETIVLC